MNIRLIVCDIEGCIMPSQRGAADLSELAPLADYCRAARCNSFLPPLVFCTGRQIPYAECVAQMLDAFFPGFPSIVENGAFLLDIARNEITPHPLLTASAFAVLRDVQRACGVLQSGEGATKEAGKEACISLNPRAGQSVETLFEIASGVLQSYHDAIEITHSKSAVDITPRGIDKASGVLALSEKTGIAPTQMLGIGDTRGDLPMLNKVGFPCGPANATDEVRACGAWISPSCGAHGVAEILERFTAWRE